MIVLPLTAVGVGAATTPTPGPDTQVTVPSGLDVATLPGASAFGDTPADTPETVSFVLREQNESQLASSVTGGARNFLTVGQFASRYGQSPADVAALRSYLAKFGISTSAYADNIDVVATGTAGEFDRALSVQQHQYHVPRQSAHAGTQPVPAQTVHGTGQSPRLPYRLAKFVQAVLGLTNYAPFTSHAIRPDTSAVKPQAGSPDSCVALTGLPKACNLPSDFAADYGLNSLYHRGATGAGQTLAIVTLAALDPGAPQYFWQNVAHVPTSGRSVTVTNVDGGPGAPSDASGSGETDLDVEQSGALAPGANVIVYQAPNTDPGFADAFFDAASQNRAGSISTSWGESETAVQAAVASGQETPAYLAAFDEVFLELAAQGQSSFAAAGDYGAYDAAADIGTTDLSVDTPGDSPFLTTAGGTTLAFTGQVTGPDGSATVTVPTQRTWGWDYLWKALAQVSGESEATVATDPVNIGGTGGGFSRFEPTPSYQQRVPGTHNFNAVQYLTPTTYQSVAPGLTEPTAWTFNPSPAVTHGAGSGRALPDISANADPYTGYLLYEPSFAAIGQPVLQGMWGGTSFVAPQLNGSAAVIDSLLGHRTGFWNPVSYASATSNRSPFTALSQASTGNDNLYYTGNPGQPYNPASGLGYPNLSALAADFASRG